MSIVRVATFNVNSVRSRLHILEKWLGQNEIDILCLQETKTVDDTFPSDFFENMGYHVAYRGEKSYNGVAIASRFPFQDIIYGFDDGEEPSGETRLISCRISSLSVINAYVPQGKTIDHPDYIYKMSFLRRIENMVNSERFRGSKIIWVGDLNVAPLDIDVTNPEKKRNHVCLHEDVREVFKEVKDSVFVDIFRKHRPGEGEFSFWDYRVKDSLQRNIGWRIDHVLATDSLASKSKDCYVERETRSWEKPSDHAPVVSVFELDDFKS